MRNGVRLMVRGQVRGKLTVGKEMIKCQLVIGGELCCDRGQVIGGDLTVTGGVRIALLGSESGMPTRLILGAVPLLAAQLRKIGPLVARLTARAVELARKHSMITTSTRVLTNDQKETVTELSCEVDGINQQIEQLRLKETQLKEEMSRTRTLHIEISKQIYAGVILQVGGEEFVFTQDVKGPVRIGWNENRKVQCRQGTGEIRPIGDFARIIERDRDKDKAA